MINWSPHPGPQMAFCQSSEYEVLFGGSAGPGKTACLVMEAIRFCHLPDYKALLLRRTSPQMEEIKDRTWKWYPQLGGTFIAQENRWHFSSGAIVKLGHCQHENDKYNYWGQEYQFIGFDELTKFTKSQYQYIKSRCRSSNPHVVRRIRATTNPGGIGHKWVYDYFVHNYDPGESYVDPKSGLTKKYISATVEDNPTLFLNDPQYLKNLESLPEVEKKRLRYGIWDTFEGQVFMELSKDVHGFEPFDIPADWYKFMSFDWGFSKPFSCLWFAVDPDETVYLYREWYGCDEKKLNDGEPDVGLRMLNQDIAAGILGREKENIGIRVADPSIWNKTPLKQGGQGPSVQEDMGNCGVWFIKADNDRLQGIQQVHERLRIENILNDDGVIVQRKARCYIFNDLIHFWRTMTSLAHDKANPEDVDTDQEDHVYDNFRYGCMHRPIIPKIRRPEQKNTFQVERKRYIKAKEVAARRGVSMQAAYASIR